VLGGARATEEVWPGYRVSTASYVMSLLQPRILRELELAKFGFEVLPTDHLFVPFPDGRYLVFWDDLKKTCAEIAKFSKKDAETYPLFDSFLHDAAKLVRELLWMTPPNPTSSRLADVKGSLVLLFKLRKLGAKFFRFADLMTESISDFLDRYFESEELKAVLAYYGSIGTFAGPRTPGTAYVLLHHLMGEHEGAGGWGFIRGGMGAISLAIARSAARYGPTIRSGAEVGRITTKEGRVSGVVLPSGEEISARIIVSNADPKPTFLGLLDERELPSDFVEQVRSYKTYSTASRSTWLSKRSLDTTPSTLRRSTPYPTYIHIGPSIDYMERAYDDAKYGRPSSRPFISAVLPTFVDPDLAPKGKHILNLFGGHAPYTLKGSTWDEERDRLADTVIETLSEYAPNLEASVLHRQVLAPRISRESSPSPMGASSTESSRSISFSSYGRPRVMPITGARSRGSTSAAHRHTPGAG